jgi:Raf kinase inhibitor-like YbhB/YbcL family protein
MRLAPKSTSTRALIAAVVATALTVSGCNSGGTSTGGATIVAMQVTSSAFGESGSIPAKYTCDGGDVSPPLAWSGAPAATKAIALTVLDPDARDFVHWLAANLPTGLSGDGSIPEAATGSPAAGVEGRNSGGKPSWYGPCPPSGEHRYVFTIYALSERPELEAGFTRDQLTQAIEGKVLASGTLTARYRR